MKFRLLIAVAVTSIAVVATAKTARPVFDATKIDVSTSPNSRVSSIFRRLASTTHPSTFIAPEGLFGCADEADCEAKGISYYKRIGALDAAGNPTPGRGTMQAWLATHGFSPNPLAPKSDEIRAVYFNRADLGFGRDLHCRSYRKGIGSATFENPRNILQLNRQMTPPLATTGRVATTGPAATTRAIRLGPLPTGTVSACYVTNFGDSTNPLSSNGNEQQAIAKAKANSQPNAPAGRYGGNGGQLPAV